LTPLPRASAASRGADAVVIGGGFAGLAAATRLAEQGTHVVVLEARPALGGRATAFTDPATGERVDNGQHMLLGCYRDTFQFLDRIGAADHVRIQDRLTVDMIDREGRASRLACPALAPPFNLLGGLLTWKALGWRDRLAATRIRGAVRDAGRPCTGRQNDTVRDWLLRHHQTTRLIEMLWEPLAVAALNQSIDAAAAAPFVRALADMLGDRSLDASLVFPVKPLDEMYALPARAYIEKHGGQVRTNAPATIDVSISGGAGLQVRTRAEEFRAAAVICAVPWFALPDVFIGAPEPLRPTIDAARRTGSRSDRRAVRRDRSAR